MCDNETTETRDALDSKNKAASKRTANEWPLAFVLVGWAFAVVAVIWILHSPGACQ